MRALLGLVVAGLVASSIVPAQAENWCGFHQKTNAHIRCGYSSLAQCKQALGIKTKKTKGTTCRLDPSFAKAKSGMRIG